MNSIWIASAVLFAGALASAWLDRLEPTLAFAAGGFLLVHLAESSFDWRRRITRANWRQAIFEERVPTTIVGKVSQFLGFACLFGFVVDTLT